MDITTEQRYIDKDCTRPYDGHFNVMLEGKYVGCVYAVGSEWQYGFGQFERCRSFESATLHVVAEHKDRKEKERADRRSARIARG